MKTWLKGGLIGGFMGIVFAFIVMIALIMGESFGVSILFSFFLYCIYFFICGFGLGIPIGAIIGYVKKSKKLHYWKKGALMGIIIATLIVAIFVLAFLIYSINNSKDSDALAMNLGFGFIVMPVMFVVIMIPVTGVCAFVGSIMGLIIQQIKSKQIGAP